MNILTQKTACIYTIILVLFEIYSFSLY